MLKNTYTMITAPNGSHSYFCVIENGINKKISVQYDLEFDPIIKKHKWLRTKLNYIVCTCHKLLMHRIVTNAEKGTYVDHRNHITFDNRIKNLKVGSPADNSKNRKPNKDSKYNLPVPGIILRGNGWRVTLIKNGVKFFKSGIPTIHEAICYRIRKEYELNPNECPNYRNLLAKMPRDLLLIYFPEIYGRYNYKFINTPIFNAHYKGKNKNNWFKHCDGIRKVGTNV